MNGAFFGTKKVIGNCINMINCKRTRHGPVQKSFLSFFMIYMTALYALQFFIVGAMFAAVYAFFNAFFKSMFEDYPKLY